MAEAITNVKNQHRSLGIGGAVRAVTHFHAYLYWHSVTT